MKLKSLNHECNDLGFVDIFCKDWDLKDHANFVGFMGIKILPLIEMLERQRDKSARIAISYVVDLQIDSGGEEYENFIVENIEKIEKFLSNRIKYAEKLDHDDSAKAANMALCAALVTIIYVYIDEKKTALNSLKATINLYTDTLEFLEVFKNGNEMQSISNQISFISSYKVDEKKAEMFEKDIKKHSEKREAKKAYSESEEAVKH